MPIKLLPAGRSSTQHSEIPCLAESADSCNRRGPRICEFLAPLGEYFHDNYIGHEYTASLSVCLILKALGGHHILANLFPSNSWCIADLTIEIPTFQKSSCSILFFCFTSNVDSQVLSFKSLHLHKDSWQRSLFADIMGIAFWSRLLFHLRKARKLFSVSFLSPHGTECCEHVCVEVR